MTNDEILSIFKESKALLEGHFRLTSGLHSPNYFQCAKVLQYPAYAERLCTLIADRYRGAKVDAVNAYGVTPLSLAATQASAKLVEALLKAGVPHEYEEFGGAHTWDYWELHLEDSLLFFARACAA